MKREKFKVIKKWEMHMLMSDSFLLTPQTIPKAFWILNVCIIFLLRYQGGKKAKFTEKEMIANTRNAILFQKWIIPGKM